MFERFYRCDPSRNQPDDSGVLGLAIVRSIMQLHGVRVTVKSTGAGTRFCLVFLLQNVWPNAMGLMFEVFSWLVLIVFTSLNLSRDNIKLTASGAQSLDLQTRCQVE
nr:ATP-binding protein [Pseudomonas costantinii]